MLWKRESLESECCPQQVCCAEDQWWTVDDQDSVSATTGVRREPLFGFNGLVDLATAIRLLMRTWKRWFVVFNRKLSAKCLMTSCTNGCTAKLEQDCSKLPSHGFASQCPHSLTDKTVDS